jgi:hypothetical protein
LNKYKVKIVTKNGNVYESVVESPKTLKEFSNQVGIMVDPKKYDFVDVNETETEIVTLKTSEIESFSVSI